MIPKTKISKNFGASIDPSGHLAKKPPHVFGTVVPTGQK
jgi:hypothetical protein